MKPLASQSHPNVLLKQLLTTLAMSVAFLSQDAVARSLTSVSGCKGTRSIGCETPLAEGANKVSEQLITQLLFREFTMTFFQIERKAVETGEIETMRGENGHITIAPLFRKTACEFEKALILEDIFVDKLGKLPGFDGKSLKLASATHEIVESGGSKEIFIVVKLAINGEPTEVTVCIDIDDFIQALNELRHKNPETDLDEVT